MEEDRLGGRCLDGHAAWHIKSRRGPSRSTSRQLVQHVRGMLGSMGHMGRGARWCVCQSSWVAGEQFPVLHRWLMQALLGGLGGPLSACELYMNRLRYRYAPP